MINPTAIQKQAIALAKKAKPGVAKIDGKIYALVFDANEWIYKVYEDGFWLVNFNTKSITIAKKWLVEYLKG